MSIENNELLTCEQVRKWLEEHGKTHQQVADALGVSLATFRSVVYDINKGTRGDGHKVAVAMRLKKRPQSAPPPIIPEPKAKPAAKAGRKAQQTQTATGAA